jgi:opacity protein-like surface antigen
MVKKLLMVFVLVMSFATCAFAATNVNPPYAVGTYNDFGKYVRLDINPNYSNASQFEVDYTKGYNATTGFKSFVISATTNTQINRYQWVCRTGFQASSKGWWTVKVYSIAADGTKSAPFTTNVNVIR